ncbi:hypothetical protein BGX38DRAFT_1174499 [Terfezia claveryi]|nr:hypothetical protein BGX38DRAFT_1174499 [Terfezia claveryi]
MTVKACSWDNKESTRWITLKQKIVPMRLVHAAPQYNPAPRSPVNPKSLIPCKDPLDFLSIVESSLCRSHKFQSSQSKVPHTLQGSTQFPFNYRKIPRQLPQVPVRPSYPGKIHSSPLQIPQVPLFRTLMLPATEQDGSCMLFPLALARGAKHFLLFIPRCCHMLSTVIPVVLL